jgi:hypothetical protein
MANTVKPVAFAPERWMRMPGIGNPGSTLGDLFVFSGYADFTGGPITEALTGLGGVDTEDQEDWIEYNITKVRIGPHWLRVHGISPLVVIGGHSQASPDEADAMGFRVQGITNVQLVEDSAGVRRIELDVNAVVRGGFDGQILTLAYQVNAWGMLANPIGTEGIFFAGASDPT